MFVQSCDTFVALPPATNGCVIFGKNSDRPPSEVQEVIYNQATDHGSGTTVQTTYIEIEQVEHTYAVVLSKPAWMWGAEMGANEHSVCIGNEAVCTTLFEPSDIEERLLGMDLVRLGLERGKTAREALDVITGLLEKYGQGGPCFETPGFTSITYHNSFLIADSTEAWVLETAGKLWAAERITSGVRNISNLLTIGDKFDAKSKSLDDGISFSEKFHADFQEMDFKEKELPRNRYACGKRLMEKSAENGSFDVLAMMEILRNEESGICRTGPKSSSVGSQVSLLFPPGSGKPHCHWFTATPNPHLSVFKPFLFCPDVNIGNFTKSPEFGSDDPAKIIPRFAKEVDRQHPLYRAHANKVKPLSADLEDSGKVNIMAKLKEMEKQSIGDLESFLADFDDSKSEELKDLFFDAVDTEMKFYV